MGWEIWILRPGKARTSPIDLSSRTKRHGAPRAPQRTRGKRTGPHRQVFVDGAGSERSFSSFDQHGNGCPGSGFSGLGKHELNYWNCPPERSTPGARRSGVRGVRSAVRVALIGTTTGTPLSQPDADQVKFQNGKSNPLPSPAGTGYPPPCPGWSACELTTG